MAKVPRPSAVSLKVWLRETNICVTLAEDLNLFYAHFDRDNKDPVQPLMPSSDTGPVLSIHEVRICMRNINRRKVASPDGVLGRVHKVCAGKLAEVFTQSITSHFLQLGFQHASKVLQ